MATGSAYPLKSLTALPEHRVWAVFSDDTEGEADLSYLLDIPYMAELKDPEFFATVRVDPDGVPRWGEGDDLDASWEDIFTQVTGRHWTEALPTASEAIAVVEAQIINPPDVYVKFSDGTDGTVRLTNFSGERVPADMERPGWETWIWDGRLIWNNIEFDIVKIHQHITAKLPA